MSWVPRRQAKREARANVQSVRSKVAGSTVLARRAGSQLAIAPTTAFAPMPMASDATTTSETPRHRTKRTPGVEDVVADEPLLPPMKEMGQFVHPLAREQVKRDGQPEHDGCDNQNGFPGSRHCAAPFDERRR
jgi:hypothetical protein